MTMTKRYVETDRLHALEGEGPWTPEQIALWLAEGQPAETYWYALVVARVAAKFPEMCRSRWSRKQPGIAHAFDQCFNLHAIVDQFPEVMPLVEELLERGFDLVSTEDRTDARLYKFAMGDPEAYPAPPMVNVFAYPKGDGKCTRVRDYENDRVQKAYRWVCGDAVPGVEVPE